jgi:hypothetical protein
MDNRKAAVLLGAPPPHWKPLLAAVLPT